MKRYRIFIIIIIFQILLNQSIFAYHDETHELITKYAVLNSILKKTDFLKSMGFDKGVENYKIGYGSSKWSILDWIVYGSTEEDATNKKLFVPVDRRYDNHFHNPFYSIDSYESAGIDDWIYGGTYHVTADSAIMWGQNKGQNNQEDYPGGDNSWDKLREYYYKSLTESNIIMPSGESRRDVCFAALSVGLGHQVHLIQDSSVPEHVRNDAHPWPDGDYENWYKNNPGITKIILNLKLIQIWVHLL